jgi:hypothetical protein
VLKRYESKNGDVTSLRIATDIEPSTDLAQQVDGESNPIAGFYSLTVTATVTGKNPISETRIYEIRQRTVS